MKRRKNIKIQESWKEREKKHQVMKRRKNIKIQESWKEREKETPSDEKKREY